MKCIVDGCTRLETLVEKTHMEVESSISGTRSRQSKVEQKRYNYGDLCVKLFWRERNSSEGQKTHWRL